MNTEYLREFIALSRSASLSAAAKQLHVSQSALSKHVSALEAEFGAPLVLRVPQIELTPAGEILLGRAQAVLDLIEQAKREITVEKKTASAQVRIKLPNASDIATQELLACANEFKRLHPGINITLMASSNDDPLSDIRSGELDGGMYTVLAKEPESETGEFEFAPLCDDSIFAWVHVDSPLAQKDQLHPNDLNGVSMPIPSKDQTVNAEIYINHFKSAFSIEPNVTLVPENSIEDFLIQRLTPEDVVLLMDNNPYSTVIAMQSDRVRKYFEPEVRLVTYYAFGTGRKGAKEEPRRHAVALFKNFMRERYLATHRA